MHVKSYRSACRSENYSWFQYLSLPLCSKSHLLFRFYLPLSLTTFLSLSGALLLSISLSLAPSFTHLLTYSLTQSLFIYSLKLWYLTGSPIEPNGFNFRLCSYPADNSLHICRCCIYNYTAHTCPIICLCHPLRRSRSL